jgi:hypothetical protein
MVTIITMADGSISVVRADGPMIYTTSHCPTTTMFSLMRDGVSRLNMTFKAYPDCAGRGKTE